MRPPLASLTISVVEPTKTDGHINYKITLAGDGGRELSSVWRRFKEFDAAFEACRKRKDCKDQLGKAPKKSGLFSSAPKDPKDQFIEERRKDCEEFCRNVISCPQAEECKEFKEFRKLIGYSDLSADAAAAPPAAGAAPGGAPAANSGLSGAPVTPEDKGLGGPTGSANSQGPAPVGEVPASAGASRGSSSKVTIVKRPGPTKQTLGVDSAASDTSGMVSGEIPAAAAADAVAAAADQRGGGRPGTGAAAPTPPASSKDGIPGMDPGLMMLMDSNSVHPRAVPPGQVIGTGSKPGGLPRQPSGSAKPAPKSQPKPAAKHADPASRQSKYVVPSDDIMCSGEQLRATGAAANVDPEAMGAARARASAPPPSRGGAATGAGMDDAFGGMMMMEDGGPQTRAKPAAKPGAKAAPKSQHTVPEGIMYSGRYGGAQGK